MSARFEVHETTPGSFHWVLRAQNGKVTAAGETHRRRVGDACRAADAVQCALGFPADWPCKVFYWSARGESDFWTARGPRRSRRNATLRAWRPA
jgi:uncharacterized protein YegP (UPF0339 family)